MATTSTLRPATPSPLVCVLTGLLRGSNILEGERLIGAIREWLAGIGKVCDAVRGSRIDPAEDNGEGFSSVRIEDGNQAPHERRV